MQLVHTDIDTLFQNVLNAAAEIHSHLLICENSWLCKAIGNYFYLFKKLLIHFIIAGNYNLHLGLGKKKIVCFIFLGSNLAVGRCSKYYSTLHSGGKYLDFPE